MRNLAIITGIVMAIFLGNASSAISETNEYIDLVMLNKIFTQQANWMHEIPDSFHVDKASITLIGSAAEFGSDTFKLWVHITDDATSNINFGEDPFFVTTLILSNFDSIVTTKNLNDTQIGWLNGDGNIYVHLFTTNEFNQVVPGRFAFQVNASRLTAESSVPEPMAMPWIPLLLLDE